MSNTTPPPAAGSSGACELTILMPCLNEAETLATCINKAKAYLERANISGEVLISDNGSTDGSIEIAESCGARVTHAPVKGYGAALWHGIQDAYGAYVIMGDSDDSYDFSSLDPFVEKLRQGHDLVMGNRFKGGIAPGAMPFLHKYLGNPVLSFIGRLFFHIPVGDFHCGLRGFRRDKMVALHLMSPGMEFASEMIVRSALAGYSIAEVPTTLSPDGRSRPPHLKTWRDGWRHLRFLLLFSPRWLFFYPSLVFLLVGGLLTLLLAKSPISLAPNIYLDVHTMVITCFMTLVGAQGVSLAILARRFTAARGILPARQRLNKILHAFTLERALIVAALMAIAGLAGILDSVMVWVSADLGPLEYGSLVKQLVLSGTAITIAIQLVFIAFLGEVLEIKISPQADSGEQES